MESKVLRKELEERVQKSKSINLFVGLVIAATIRDGFVVLAKAFRQSTPEPDDYLGVRTWETSNT